MADQTDISAYPRMARPRLCFTGSFLGRHPGFPPDYVEKLASLLSSEGYAVRRVSGSRYRLARLVETVYSLIAWRDQVDIVLTNVFSGMAFVLADAASLVANRLGKPVILMLHGGNLPAFALRNPVWTRRVFRRAQAIVAPSRYLAECVALPAPARVIPNVVPIQDYGFRLRQDVQPNLMWMRTFDEVYQPLMAVETLCLLLETHPDVHLTMAGQDQGLLREVKAQVENDGLQTHVSLAGFLDIPGKQGAFNDHDIFLNTNRVDNMPVSLIEAAASGLPIVATGVGGIPYMFSHEETALLVENANAAQMARAVRRLLAEPELARRLSQNGRKLAETFTWPQVKPLWEELFAQLI